MKKENTYRIIFWIAVLFISFMLNKNTYATHAQSADITYQCIGPNQYEIRVSFYRDCSGVNAPNSININTSSASCNQNFFTQLFQIPSTGIDVTPICNTMTTVCNGGNYPGVEEYIYQGIINLPANCNDWTFSFTLCCRNNAINTINNPGGQNIYVAAELNNLDVTCNNSPTFSNTPVSFPCVGQTSCINHGAIEPDGDSLYYSLIAPGTGAGTSVTYIAGYSAQQPLNSSPAVTFNPLTGDICMTPTLQEVTVLAVKVEEWRNGIFIGSVIRDIQLRTVGCTNTLPTLFGINGTNQFSLTSCAGTPINFNIPSFDPDSGQTLTINWNNAIPNATFTANSGQNPTANFSWTPSIANISAAPYCFTLAVSDDNCPFIGVQIYSFCITVAGFTTTSTSTPANCGASNGTASAMVQGGQGPYTYQWTPYGGNNPTANGLLSGQYSVVVTDANGCISTSTVNVPAGPLPGNINMTSTNVSCFGGSNGTATANVNGGQQPYVYLWSNGGFNPTITNLTTGTYFVTVTSNGGCVTTDTVIITAPSTPVSTTSTQNNTTCFGGNDGSATVIPSGGTSPYTAVWNTNPVQNNLNATGLINGVYSVIITDYNGCSATHNVTITQPQPLNLSLNIQQNVSCFNGNNGSVSVNITGGTGPYSYNWNNNSYPNNNAINGLTAGVYLLNVSDTNGCSALSQFTITEPTQLLTSVVNFNDITCYGFNDGAIQTSTVGGTPPYSYQWATNPSITGNASNLGLGYHVLTVTDNNGCMDTTAANINEPSSILTILQGGDTICPGQNLALVALAFGGAGNYIYQWNNGNTGATQMVSPSSTTTYSVFATDANGCVGTTDSAIVLVNDISLVNLSIVPDTSLCEGSPYLISANISGGIGTYSFNWNNGLGQGQGPFIVAPLLNTTYLVTVTDDCGNSLDKPITVNVNPLPSANLQPQTETGCGNVTLNLSNNGSNPIGVDYLWDFGDATYSSLANPMKNYSISGVYNITLTITTLQGCVNSDQANINIIIDTQPIAQFEFDPKESTVLNPQITFDNFSIDADYYEWTFGDGASSSQINPVHNYEKDGTYLLRLIASNNSGCKDTATDILLIEPQYSFYIPNAFTPDNDGNNDVFTAVGEEIQYFNMQIFNRWGELIYETKSLEQGWNGSAKSSNKISMEGVYVYKIKLKDWQGTNHKFVGHVSLLK